MTDEPDREGSGSAEVDELDFDLETDETGSERTGLIRDAAGELDDLGILLSPGKQRKTLAAELALELDEDDASLARPVVTKLDTSKLSVDAPVRKSDLLDHWRFYWVTFPVSVWARPGRGFNRLEFKAEFNADDDERTRPRTHAAMPNQQFTDLVRAKGGVKLGVGGRLKFAVDTPDLDLTALGLPAQAGAGLELDGKMETELGLGPIDYSLRVPTVKRSNLELDRVLWRLEGSHMVQEDDPGLRAVLKVPVGTTRLHMTAVMRARRFTSTLDGTLMEAIGKIPEKFQYFFTKGAPIGDKQTWDLSEEL
jgi:hypothetical protein